MNAPASDRSRHNLHPSARRGPAGNYGLELHEYYDRVKKPGNCLASSRPPPGGSFVAETTANEIGGTQRSLGVVASTRSLSNAGNAVLGSASPSSRRSAASLKQGTQAQPPLLRQQSAPLQHRGATGKDWNWCLGGRKQPSLPHIAEAEKQPPAELSRSFSSPAMNMGTSMLTGLPAEPFFGEFREFGANVWDGRMRGGANARNGWAGTFPVSHARGCMPWAR